MHFAEGEPAPAFSDLPGIVEANAAPKVEARLHPLRASVYRWSARTKP